MYNLWTMRAPNTYFNYLYFQMKTLEKRAKYENEFMMNNGIVNAHTDGYIN